MLILTSTLALVLSWPVIDTFFNPRSDPDPDFNLSPYFNPNPNPDPDFNPDPDSDPDPNPDC